MATQKTSSSVPLTLFTFFLFLITNAKSDSFSFNYPNFKDNVNGLGFLGDAAISNGVLHLTKQGILGQPIQNSVGLAGFFAPVRIYDKTKNPKFANFVTEFSFIVNRNGSPLHGDGMTFFLASPDIKLPNPEKSVGGFLGLFDPKTAFDPSKNQVVAVEFDSYTNEWDPVPPYPATQSPHIGIDVQSIRSAATVEWPSDSQPDGALGKARISYDFETKEMRVLVTYPTKKNPLNGATFLSHKVDLRKILPESVIIGFSAATGDLVETHDLLSWRWAGNF